MGPDRMALVALVSRATTAKNLKRDMIVTSTADATYIGEKGSGARGA